MPASLFAGIMESSQTVRRERTRTMLDYFQTYYLEVGYGPGYIATNITYVVAVVLLLGSIERSARNLLLRAAESLLLWAGAVVFCSVYYCLIGHAGMDRLMMALIIVCYAVFRSRYSVITRVVRSCTFYACTILAIPISEPVGEAIEEIDASFTWAEHLTWVIMVIMMALTLIVLRRFSTEGLTFVPVFPAVLVASLSGVAVALQMIYEWIGSDKLYNIIVAGCFWLVELFHVYLFHLVCREYDQNLELLALQQKEELNRELLEFSQENYLEMHMIRHEIKNHLSYLKTMAEAGDLEHLRSYLGTVLGETEKLFQFVECGNDTINGVMNHAVRQARARDVAVEHTLIVPPSLPYRETDLCSLLSNLMDNAIEGAAQSGSHNPVVTVRIRPQRGYLFFRVTNPVDSQIPASRRLSLRTTKKDDRLHGFGTRMIRRIAERYQGSAKYAIRDGQFIADVMLYLPGGEEHESENLPGDL